MNRDLIQSLDRARDPERFGAKAAHLARLSAAGIRTSPGFVLDVQLLEEHLGRLGLRGQVEALFSTVMTNGGAVLPDAAPLRRAVAEGHLDSVLDGAVRDRLRDGVRYAVRSSAPGEDGESASFAGQFDTVLGCASPGEVVSAVGQVWASLLGERALRYAGHRRRVPRGMAVIIQRQVDAVVSGVMFTRDPRAGREDHLLLEYCAGPGDALVSGRVTPGRLRIHRERGEAVVEQPPGTALDWDPRHPGAAAETRRLAERLESLFGGPQDVEWCVDAAGVLHVLQTRPVTATWGDAPAEVWTNANIAENFPDPVCPLLRSFVARGYTAYFRGLALAFGLSRRRLDAMDAPLARLVDCHGGRLYYNLSNIHRVLHLTPCGAWLTRFFNQFTGAGQFPPPVSLHQGRLARALERMRVTAAVTRCYLFVQARVRRFEGTVDRYADASHPRRLGGMSPPELGELLTGFLDIRLRRWTDAALADTAAMVCYGVLRELLRDQDGIDAGDLLRGLPGLASAIPVEKLWELSRQVRRDPALYALFMEQPPDAVLARLRDGRFSGFRTALERYFDTWGFRYSGELMLSHPTPREDPLPALRLLRSYAAMDGDGPAEVSRRQQQHRAKATRAVRHRLRGWRRIAFRPLLRATQGAIRLRERARMKQALLYTRLRLVALSLGEALVSRGVLVARDDVLFLTMEEAIALAGDGVDAPADPRAVVSARRAEHQACMKPGPPDSFTLPRGEFWRPPESEDGSGGADPEAAMTGIGACGGRVRGPAVVVPEVSGIHRIRQGQILVTRQTDPGWAAVFFMLDGLVIERGGLLSHGAIIAREYGIPAVIGVADACRRIGDGETLQVDGDKGRVTHVRD